MCVNDHVKDYAPMTVRNNQKTRHV